MSQYHIPVMLKEALDYLQVKKGAWYVDCNLGGGGHTKAILEAGGKVLGLDLDPEAITEVANQYQLQIKKSDHLEAQSENLILYQTNFINLQETVNKFKIGPVKGILFDLGVSSHQLETVQRGFSFNTTGPLDMRMSPTLTVKASDLVNGLHEGELVQLFQKYGEENFAKPIARKIIQYRKNKPITTADELAKIILLVRHRSPSDPTHPATRVFQALRMAVNDELNSLKKALPTALAVLAPQGKLVVLSFHSLEDRIVKNFFKDEEENNSITILTQKPITPDEEEISSNPRSHSGKLRAAVKK